MVQLHCWQLGREVLAVRSRYDVVTHVLATFSTAGARVSLPPAVYNRPFAAIRPQNSEPHRLCTPGDPVHRGHTAPTTPISPPLGLPAGAYWPPGNGFGWHAWAEVWAAGRWYTVDPTWNQPIADATHVKLADGGPAEQARIVMLLGRLKVQDLKY